MKATVKYGIGISIALAAPLFSSIAFAQEKAEDQQLAPLPDAAAPATPATTPAPKNNPTSESPPARDGITYVAPSAPSAPSFRSESAPAAPESQQGVPRLGDAKNDTRESFWKFGMGVRGGRVDSPGFDAFTSNSQLWQYSLSASRTLFASGRLSFAAGAAWDVGQRDDTQARGLQAGIAVHRLTVPLEARFHAASWLYGFARVAPGADYRKAWITDPSASTGELDSSAWSFATDLSLGASFLMGPQGKPQSHGPRFWITPEFGYAYATSTDLTFAPKGAASDPQLTGTTNLGELALRGPFARVAVELSF